MRGSVFRVTNGDLIMLRTPPHSSATRRRVSSLATALVGSVVAVVLVLGVVVPSGSTAAAQAVEHDLRPSFIGAPYFAPGAVYTQNFPDPSVVWDPATQRYYAFSTTTGGVNVPVMWSTDLVTWTARTTHSIPNANFQFHDALPDPSPPGHPWQSSQIAFPDELWAPAVARLSGNGSSSWVMFYALRMNDEGKRCIFYATSPTPDGPYLSPRQIYCGDRPLGYIDPSVYADPTTGRTWLLIKDEGQVGVAWSTIWAREISLAGPTTVAWTYPDGNANGWFTPLLSANGGWDRGVVENPSLMRLSDGQLTLFYSGGWWDSTGYSMGRASCRPLQFSWTPLCSRVGDGQVMRSRNGRVGIGGSAVFVGSTGEPNVANHYWEDGLSPSYPTNQRRLMIDRLYETPGGLAFSIEPGASGQAPPSGYVPIGPTRVVDTRNGTGVSSPRRLEAGEVFVVDVSPVTNASTTSVTANVTVDGPGGTGFLSVFPCGDPPSTSTLNYLPGSAIPNVVTVRLNGSRHFCVFTQWTTDLIIDVQGRFDSTLASGATPVTPTRLVDTRASNQLPAGGSISVQIAGVAGIPSGATAAFVSITSDRSVGPGYLVGWNCSGAPPTASNVNYGTFWPSGNGAVVPLSANGSLCVASSNRADAIVDVFGYVAPTGQRLNSVAPTRLLDSRTSIGLVNGGQDVAVTVTGSGRAAAGSTAVVVNITATEARHPGWVSVFPCSSPPAPGAETSVLNLVAGQTKAAHVVVPVGTSGAGAGQICLRTQNATHLIVDLFGGFG